MKIKVGVLLLLITILVTPATARAEQGFLKEIQAVGGRVIYWVGKKIGRNQGRGEPRIVRGAVNLVTGMDLLFRDGAAVVTPPPVISEAWVSRLKVALTTIPDEEGKPGWKRWEIKDLPEDFDSRPLLEYRKELTDALNAKLNAEGKRARVSRFYGRVIPAGKSLIREFHIHDNPDDEYCDAVTTLSGTGSEILDENGIFRVPAGCPVLLAGAELAKERGVPFVKHRSPPKSKEARYLLFCDFEIDH